MTRIQFVTTFALTFLLLLVAPLVSPSAVAQDESATSASDATATATEAEEAALETPWDYDPYRVLIWIASDDPSIRAETTQESLRKYLDRDFAALWRFDIADAPAAVRSSALRHIDQMSFDAVTASDPVLAVKRDHKDAVRIRTPATVAQYVNKVMATRDRMEEVKRRGEEAGDATVAGVMAKCEAIGGDAIALQELWANPDTEAMLLSRGMALTLDDPEGKLITPPISGLVAKAIDEYDKIFVVRVSANVVPLQVAAIELDTLMRHFGPVAQSQAATVGAVSTSIGRAVTDAFAPVVRIENAGQRSATGLLRAGGLIREEDRETSPAAINVGDVLEPMIRKNDRNGKPILIGPMDFAFLTVEELKGYQGRNIEMDFFAGRASGLQGRKNKRTFRMALKVRPFGERTLLRLHLQKDPDFPLIGYELYDKDLKSKDMTFVGRTDWNGRLMVEPNDKPLRLLYVKNGGAVLARLPIVPGLYPKVVADLRGDDMRLQAEAYIRGVQNSIVDLLAIRELFKARVRLRLERGEMDKAEELMIALRDQPDSDSLYKEIGKKQIEFLKAIGTGQANQRRKVDEMFTTTRELMAKHITPRLLRELENDMIAARENGGKLPADRLKNDDEEAEPEPSESAPDSQAAATQ